MRALCEGALFVAKRDDWVDEHRAACGNVRRQEYNYDEQHSDRDKSDWIVGSHAKQQIPHQLGQCESCTNSDRHSYQRQLCALPQNHLRTSPRCAPSAMRIPISRLRCDTMKEITP